MRHELGGCECVCSGGGRSGGTEADMYAVMLNRLMNEPTHGSHRVHSDAVTMRSWNWNTENEIMKSSESSPSFVLIYSHANSERISCFAVASSHLHTDPNRCGILMMQENDFRRERRVMGAADKSLRAKRNFERKKDATIETTWSRTLGPVRKMCWRPRLNHIIYAKQWGTITLMPIYEKLCTEWQIA